MKLIRYGAPGSEKPGLVDTDGRVRDLSAHVSDVMGDALDRRTLEKLSRLEPGSLPLVQRSPRLSAPVGGVGKIVGIGLNYSDHAAEAGLPVPSEPIVFLKPTSSISGPNDPILLPRGSKKLDWEVELAVVIGSRAKYVSEADGLSYVAGYCVANDVSEREWQMERGPTWDKGKGFDTFCPLGPWLVTADEVGDPQALRIWLELDGKMAQDGNTATLVFGVAYLVSYVSHMMPLNPGDVIITGTPPGVGMGRKPPSYLVAGNRLRAGIDRLGEQANVIVAD